MRIRYPEVIVETEAELQRQEQQVRGQKTAVHLQMLRVLKSGHAKTLPEAAQLVGYSPTQVNRWWKAYRTGGLAALLRTPHYPGKASRLTSQARAALHAAMKRGEIITLKDAQRFLRQLGVDYPSLTGVWWQLRQERTRKKTGRRRHQRASEEQQRAFKKTLRAS